MKHTFFRVLLATLVVSLACATSYAEATAPKQRVVVSPGAVELSLAPGESVTKYLTVVNKGTDSFKLNMTAASYSVRDENYEPDYSLLPGAPDVTGWVSFTEPSRELSLAPEAVHEAVYTVTVPVDTKPGGYTVALFATTTPDPRTESVVVHNRVAVMHYITVKGAAAESGEARAEPFEALSWDGAFTLPFRVKNTGSTHFRVEVRTAIKTLWGREVAMLTKTRQVLPQTERLVTLDWQSTVPFGIYSVEQSVVYLGKTEQLSRRYLVVMHPAVALGIVLILVSIGTLVLLRWKKRRF